MDILAHGLWAGLGLRWLANRGRRVRRATAVATVTLAVLPDLVHVLPVVAWGVFDGGGWEGIWRYASAVPGGEPGLPEWANLAAHHSHCIFHSAPILAASCLLLWPWRGLLALPLAGWGSHIVIDVFTHSAQFYPVPVLYPFTYAGFDGIAWNTPWFMAINYVALMLAGLALWRSRTV